MKAFSTYEGRDTSFFVLVISFILLVFFLSGCTTKNGFLKYGKNHPDVAAEFCADEYPAKDSIIEGRTDTLVQVQTRTDTVTTTIVNEVTGKTQVVKIPCPPCHNTIKTYHKTNTIIRVDMAKVTALNIQLKKEYDAKVDAEAKVKRLEKDKKGLIIFGIITSAAFIILLVITLKK